MPRFHDTQAHYKYPCVDSCGRGFHSTRGLSIHRATCHQSQHSEMLRMEQLAKRLEEARVAARIAKKNARRELKRKARERRLLECQEARNDAISLLDLFSQPIDSAMNHIYSGLGTNAS